MKSNKMIQGYFLLDKVKITPEYETQLNELKKTYLIEWDLICEKDNRELYLGILRNSNKLNDSTDEEDNTSYGLITVMSQRNVEVLGIWNKDGTEFGTVKLITPAVYSDKDELITEEITKITGIPSYPFNKSGYINSIEPRITKDEDDKVLSTEEFYDLRTFGDFKQKINFEVTK